MNKIIKELALQAGAGEWGDSVIPAMMSVEKFAGLIRNDALEEAAKVCDTGVDTQHPTVKDHIMLNFGKSSILAAAIRAMKECGK
jgi:hypothetical protein